MHFFHLTRRGDPCGRPIPRPFGSGGLPQGQPLRGYPDRTQYEYPHLPEGAFERVKKGCHCEEPLGDVAIRIPKMFPFWLQCVQNRKVLGNGLPEGELPEGQEKQPWGAGLRPSQ